METPKREKEAYSTEPRDHEADAQAAVEELEKKGHHVLDTGDCDDNCPVCELHESTDPGLERGIIISLLRNKFNATPETLKDSLKNPPVYYTINRIRLQTLAAHPMVHVIRAKTGPRVIVEVSMTMNFDGYPITAIVRGLRPLLTSTL